MQGKAARVTLIALFLAILYIPGLVWLAAGSRLASPNLENRELAAWPEITLATLESVPSKIENYYRDHLPFRNEIISVYAQGLRAAFGDSVVTTVTFGRDGWFLYNNVKDGNPIASYRGEDLFTADELRQIYLNLVKTRDALARQGIEFVLFIVPNKERVYPEYMPDRFGAPAEEYAAKQLAEFLQKRGGLRVIYVYDEIMEAKAAFPGLPLYYSTDTHWTGIGAYIGARALMRELGYSLPALDPGAIRTEATDFKGDLANLAHLSSVLPGLDSYLVEDPARPKYTQTAGEDLRWHTGKGDKKGRKLYIKTDSFADSMLPYIVPWFSETRAFFNELYDPAMVDEFQPDVFVQVCVERYVRKWLTQGPLYAVPD